MVVLVPLGFKNIKMSQKLGRDRLDRHKGKRRKEIRNKNFSEIKINKKQETNKSKRRGTGSNLCLSSFK